MTTYECDCCGACCERLTIEVETSDVLRLPKIAEVRKPMNGRGTIPIDLDTPWLLACGSSLQCPFFGADKRCTEYAARPETCVGFQAGSKHCQEVRALAGLEPLKPIESSDDDMLSKLRSLARDWQDERRQ